ncbi:MAG: L-aspartate oxidase, partial [Spirochaetes bacterium]|nr:L-aspartate oxidase [Spirochaetota bacterium]
ALIAQDWNTLRNIMWNYAGPIRTHKRLKRAIIDLRNLQEDIEDFYRNTKLTRSTVELHNGVTVALSIVRAAISTRSSRGCHYIKDE